MYYLNNYMLFAVVFKPTNVNVSSLCSKKARLEQKEENRKIKLKKHTNIS